MLGLAGLQILSLFMVAIAIFIRLKDGYPIFFKQLRPGRYGQCFYLYKFRTMTGRRDEKGWQLPDGARLTVLGRFLRRWSIDELPGLWNVIKGEMSLVGPRPLLISYLGRYSPEQARRHEVKPGMTGWAQIHGRNDTKWEDRLRFDVWYVDHRSFWLDMQIMASTIAKIIKREGIEQPGHATMEEFTGTGANRSGDAFHGEKG